VKRGSPLRAAGALASALAALAASPALADTTKEVSKDQCVDANTQAQTLRRAGQLGAAREQLLLCGDARCPGVVRDDCAQRLDELERAQPTLVLDVQDASGQDIVAVDVRVDDKPFANRLDGRALAVDPGEHTFTFSVPGLAPVTRRLVLKEGEKERRERVVLGEPVVRESPPSPATASPMERRPGHAQRLTGIVLSGVGLAGVALGAVFGALTINDWSHSKSECPSTENCPNRGPAIADRQSALRAATVSDVGFIAGGVVVAAGIAVWLTAPSGTEDAAAVAVRVGLSFGPGGAGLALTGGF
jgi:hypothetical protein